MKYEKKVSVGAFLKKGIDFKDGDLIEIMNEGKKVVGQYGEQDVFVIKTEKGAEGNITFNQTSINNMIDAYGGESSEWIGKKAKVFGIMSNVQGKMTKVYYFAHPLAEIGDTGDFVIPGKEKDDADEDIPF